MAAYDFILVMKNVASKQISSSLNEQIHVAYTCSRIIKHCLFLTSWDHIPFIPIINQSWITILDGSHVQYILVMHKKEWTFTRAKYVALKRCGVNYYVNNPKKWNLGRKRLFVGASPTRCSIWVRDWAPPTGLVESEANSLVFSCPTPHRRSQMLGWK